MTDRDRIALAFQSLTDQGYTARGLFKCCTACCWEILKNKDKVVFWSRGEDRASFKGDNIVDPLHLQWKGDPDVIVQALSLCGMEVEAPDSPVSSVVITGRGTDA